MKSTRGAALPLEPSSGHVHGKSPARPEEKFEWAQQICRERHLRRTPAREEILQFLSRQDRPATLTTISGERRIAETCDPATVFRVLQKLEEAGLVRRIWLHERAPYYILLFPHDHRDYVLCTGCGKVEETRLECPVQKLEKEVGERLGYAEIHHELGFYGVCPDCQEKPGPGPRRSGKKSSCC